MKKLTGLLVLLLMFSGCAKSITKLSMDYKTSSDAIREFATITAEDWEFGTGMIIGALGTKVLPVWVYEELATVSRAFDSDTEEIDDYILGYMIGLRFRLATPIIEAAIEKYAPGLMQIREVLAVLTFLGG